MTTAVRAGRALPPPCGPLSAAVFERLGRAPSDEFERLAAVTGGHDPFGLDLQLTLYACYELHYRGFTDVVAEWEWNAGLVQLRGELERLLLAELRRRVGAVSPAATASAEMRRLCAEPGDGTGVGHRLHDRGDWQQMREYFVHRSVYHLKEGDPHAWLIPRLRGQAKASFVAIEFDEYGAGQGRHVHQQLFADLMAAAGLDAGYLAYLDAVPADALLTVNTMSLFGLHRRLRGAAAGQFAAIEITSPPGSQRIAAALHRMDAPDPCVRFYREHVEADAVHEQVVRSGVVEAMLADDPELNRDVVFGIRAWELCEARLDAHLQRRWDDGRTSLRRPLG